MLLVHIINAILDAACLCFEVRAIFGFFSGWTLEKSFSETKKSMKKFVYWNQHAHASHLSVLAQMQENFINTNSADPCIFTGGILQEDEYLERAKQVPDESEAFFFWLLKSFIATYLGEYERAKEFLRAMRSRNLSGGNVAMYLQTYFLGAMVELLLARSDGNKKTKKYKSCFTKLCSYTKYGQDNVINKIRLIEAEVATIKNNKKLAMTKFGQSINHAHEQGIIFEEALALERYAIALYEWNNDDGDNATKSLDLFEQSKNLYEIWGSSVKVEQLKKFIREKTGMNNAMWR